MDPRIISVNYACNIIRFDVCTCTYTYCVTDLKMCFGRFSFYVKQNLLHQTINIANILLYRRGLFCVGQTFLSSISYTSHDHDRVRIMIGRGTPRTLEQYLFFIVFVRILSAYWCSRARAITPFIGAVSIAGSPVPLVNVCRRGLSGSWTAGTNTFYQCPVIDRALLHYRRRS